MPCITMTVDVSFPKWRLRPISLLVRLVGASIVRISEIRPDEAKVLLERFKNWAVIFIVAGAKYKFVESTQDGAAIAKRGAC